MNLATCWLALVQPIARSTSLFFFQAEGGIRDGHVTGVQTCALPISALGAARRDGGDFLLALLDVDGLKHVNNQHGHDVGDLLISDVALVMGAAVRESDILARMGGDEFCVLVTTPRDSPATLRLRLVEGFRRFNATETRPYQLSASICIVAGVADDSTTVDALLACA